jgi:hypothetical protein
MTMPDRSIEPLINSDTRDAIVRHLRRAHDLLVDHAVEDGTHVPEPFMPTLDAIDDAIRAVWEASRE